MTTQTTQTTPSNWELTDKPGSKIYPNIHPSFVSSEGFTGVSYYQTGWFIKGYTITQHPTYPSRVQTYYAYNSNLDQWIKRSFPYPPKRY